MGEAGMAEHKQLFSNQMSLPALWNYKNIKQNCKKEGLQTIKSIQYTSSKTFIKKRAGL